jgi:hypothetical protein
MKIKIKIINTYIIIIFLVTYACSGIDREKGENEDHILFFKATYNDLCIDNRVDSMLSVFIKRTNCDSCLYEMYIETEGLFCQKITLRSTVPTRKSMGSMGNFRPLIYMIKDNKKVYIYSGMERIFKGDEKLLFFRNENFKESLLTFYLSEDSIRVFKDGFESPPYSEMHDEDFFPDPFTGKSTSKSKWEYAPVKWKKW